jgi:hypothetical protein
MAIFGHNHTQSEATDTWVINHALGVMPVVDVQVVHEGVLQKMIPLAVEYPSNSQVIVRFTSPRTGTARLA